MDVLWEDSLFSYVSDHRVVTNPPDTPIPAWLDLEYLLGIRFCWSFK